MKAIMVMYDSLNRHMLSPYQNTFTKTPNFDRLAQHSVTFDNCWVGSMPCMPARRELHTGRYNFLHRSWGPLEPFDDSMPQILREAGVHTHLVTDHYHYFEDGGATYHTRYNTYESVRGQEGDGFQGLAKPCEMPKGHLNVCGNPSDKWVEQDFINRQFMPTVESQPQSITFEKGLEFVHNNHQNDHWFLQLETFDPHEPFFVQEEYKQQFSHAYAGAFCDWPDYRPLNEADTPAFVQHLKMEYAALLKMCDDNLGRVLDAMDAYDLWKDTLLIVNTDHGFLLSEHGQWAKCHCPFYAEVAHTPLFVWDPRLQQRDTHNAQLVQTIDLPATLLEFFAQPLPTDMQGRPLRSAMETNTPLHDGALFGIFGGQICCTDGRYVYMRSPNEENAPLYEYTLMPMRHGGRRAFIENERLKTLQLSAPLPFSKGVPLLRIENNGNLPQAKYPSVLFDMQTDPLQQHPLHDPTLEARMCALMVRLMHENDAPAEQFERICLQ